MSHIEHQTILPCTLLSLNTSKTHNTSPNHQIIKHKKPFEKSTFLLLTDLIDVHKQSVCSDFNIRRLLIMNSFFLIYLTILSIVHVEQSCQDVSPGFK